MDFFYTKLGFGERLPGSQPQAKFHSCGFKAPEIAKIGIFGIKFVSNGIHFK